MICSVLLLTPGSLDPQAAGSHTIYRVACKVAFEKDGCHYAGGAVTQHAVDGRLDGRLNCHKLMDPGAQAAVIGAVTHAGWPSCKVAGIRSCLDDISFVLIALRNILVVEIW